MIDTTVLTIVGPAFLAGLLILATHVPLGLVVLRKGIIFIDLAIAQLAGFGALLAMVYLPEAMQTSYPWLVQGLSLAVALLGAWFLTVVERHFSDIQEPVIGCVFVLASCMGLVVLGNHPHGAEHMKDLLAGQILWVTDSQLTMMALISLVVLAIRMFFRNTMGSFGFYACFSIAVTASVQLVGVYLVFSSLIIPALAVRRLSLKYRILGGYTIGALGIVLGLIVSVFYDITSGPTIVCAQAFVALIAGRLIYARETRLSMRSQ